MSATGILSDARFRRHDTGDGHPEAPARLAVIDDALEGGVNGSLCLDGHGKSLSFLLLGDISVRLPAECVPSRG